MILFDFSNIIFKFLINHEISGGGEHHDPYI